MASSPETSPATSRFFSNIPTSAPVRTYSRRSMGRKREAEASAVNDTPAQTSSQESEQRVSDPQIPSTAPRRSTRRQSASDFGSNGLASSSRPLAESPGLQTSTMKETKLTVDGHEDPDIARGRDGRARQMAKPLAKPHPPRKLDVQSPKPTALSGGSKRKREVQQRQVVNMDNAPATIRRSSRRSSRTGMAETPLIERSSTPLPHQETEQDDAEVKERPNDRELKTPPRTVRPPLPRTPTTSSPRDFADLFAAVSPGAGKSPFASSRLHSVIGKSRSSGSVLDTPSKMRKRFEGISRQDSFGASMGSDPSTPSHRLGRTQSMPTTPSKSSPIPSEADPSALLLRSTLPEGQGSGGRAKRTYGKTRTVVAEEGETAEAAPVVEDMMGASSYADLRKRYEVDPGEGVVTPEDTMVCVSIRSS